MTNLLAEALAWHQRGHTPLPLRTDGSKAPAVPWANWQNTQPDAATVVTWFTTIDTDGLGIITGASSRNLLMLEAEGRAVDEGILDRLATAMADHDALPLWERITGGYVERTPSGGIHWYVHVDGPTLGNTKLARRPATDLELADNPGDRIKVLLETRGQGGFTVIAPSAGRTHPTAQPWTVLVGNMDTIPTITTDERDLIFAVCNVLDAMPARPAPAPTPSRERPAEDSGDSLRPGDDFNARATWADILTPHGWTHAWQRGQLHAWTRPGKHPRDGISATTGRNDGDNLYVFTSATELPTEEPLSKFHAYTLLEHAGDWTAAAKALAAAGYGHAADPITPDDLIDHSQKPATVTTLRPRLTAVPSPPTNGNTALAPHTDLTLAAYGDTEDGLARALVDHHGHQLRHVPQRGAWLQWDGARWAWDEGGAHRELTKTLARQLPDNDTWKTHRKRMLSARGVDGVAKMAATDPRIVVNAGELDADPWSINTPSGLVDLRTGDVRPATPDDLCTRLTSVGIDRRTPERWLAFLADTFDNDHEMIAYVQRLAGYSACGAQLQHTLPFLHGSGGNGKSVFLDVLVGVLGDYASTAPPDFLLASGRNDESAIARLAGLRLVACSEVNQNARFDEAKIKLLTGGDRLTARFLYGSHFTFAPTHHLWLMGNHQPRVEAGGDSFWRRLRLIPFTQQVPAEKRVEGLADQLLEQEGAQILAWIVDGAVDAINNRLREPDTVMAATATYAEEEDALARFVADRVMLTRDGRTNTADVRAAYSKWCKAEGIQELSQQAFGRELRTRWGIEAERSHGRRFYVGVVLYSDDADDGDDAPGALDWVQR